MENFAQTTNLKEIIKKHIGQVAFSTWFQALDIEEVNENEWKIWTPNHFYKQKIEQQFQKTITELETQINASISIDIATLKQIYKKQDESEKEQQTKDLNQENETKEKSLFKNKPSKYSFDNFIVGPNNSFAHAVASAVADSPGTTYNPFFLYSKVGLGKTHIMQAINIRIKEKHPESKTIYLSTEKFTNELISALQNKNIDQFREKYRTIDILLLDDIQFLAGKERTQEEFFHTFNQIYNEKKQIVLSSDRPPIEIPQLEKRLVSRFEMGITADIQQPDFETRMAILRKKSEHIKTNVQKEVLEYVATHFKSNIRELEGALLKIVALSTFQSQTISLPKAKELFHHKQISTIRYLSPEKIQKTVCEYFDISLENMTSSKRKKMFVLPRQIAMYLCRELTEYSFPEIGSFFGGRDHTTIMYAYEKIKKKMEDDKQTLNTINVLREKFRG